MGPEEAKKPSKTESFLYYGGDEIEAEGSGLGSPSTEESQALTITSFDETEEGGGKTESESTVAALSYLDPEAERNRILKEKWLRVTGKKPKNIPVVRRPFDPNIQHHIFFGDRKPGDAEKEIRRKLLIQAHKIEHLGLTFGKVRDEVRLPMALFSGLLCVRYDPSNRFLACCYRSGGVQIRDSKTTDVVMDLETLEKNSDLFAWTARFFSRDPGKIYIAGQTGIIQIYDVRTGEMLRTSESIDPVYTMDISPGGFALATGGRDGKVHVVDPITLQVASKRYWPSFGEPVPPAVYNEYHRLRVFGLKFHPMDLNVFVTGGWDNSVKIWDVRTPAAVGYINGPEIHGEGVDLRGNVLLTASWRAENSLSLWDFRSLRLIENIPITSKFTKFEGEFLYTCLFFKDDPDYPRVNSNMIAVGGSGFPALLIIDLKTRKVQTRFPSFKPIISLDICGNEVAYGGTESIFRIAEVSP